MYHSWRKVCFMGMTALMLSVLPKGIPAQASVSCAFSQNENSVHVLQGIKNLYGEDFLFDFYHQFAVSANKCLLRTTYRSLSEKESYMEGAEALSRKVLSEEYRENRETLSLLRLRDELAGTVCFTKVETFLNVREEPSKEAKIVGKLYRDCVATVISDEGDFVKLTSGNLTGYAVKDFLLFQSEAEDAIRAKYSPKAKVIVNTVNLREGAGTEFPILFKMTNGEEADFLSREGEFCKVRTSKGGEEREGYLFSDYIKVTSEPRLGETLQEEKKRLSEEAAATKAEEARKAEAKRQEEAKRAEEIKKQQEAEKKKKQEAAVQEEKPAVSGTAKQVAEYAKTAVGTAYQWGGTDLKKGVDCSGLCYASYKAYGYTLPRTSRDMSASSSLLSVSANENSLKPGDLVFYATNGRVDHVAMYIGNGNVVHASTYQTGVIISKYNYRVPYNAKRVIY